MTVKEQNAKEIENNSQGMRLAQRGPKSQHWPASAQNADVWSYKSEKNPGWKNPPESSEVD
ncbi:hypothetical protein AB4Y36_16450 [Paraburkholderia sp. BR10936]